MLIAAAVMCLSGAAQAVPERHFDPFVQKPATSPLGLFTLEGAAAGNGLEWLGVRLDYAHGLLALTNGTSSLGNVIPDRLDAHILASYAYHHWFSIGLDVPVTLHQSDGFDVVRNVFRNAGSPPATVSALFPPLPSAGFGDIRIVPKFALPFHRPFSLALIPEIRVRTGLDEGFLGDELGPIHGHAGPIFAPRAEAEGTLWRIRLVGELGYQLRGEEQYFNLVIGDQFTFGVGAELALPQVHAFESWEVIGEFNGSTQVNAPFTFEDSQHYETALELVGGVRARFVGGYLAFAGVGSGLSGGGYGRELFRAFAGFGWEPPNATSTVPVSSDEQDADHDGIPDTLDRCPQDPGSPDTDGCPDADNDDIPDIDDKCPTQLGPVENQGCPVEKPIVEYKPPKLVLLNAGINFETGSAKIQRDSFKVVDAVAKFLREHPEIKKVQVEGHTDNRGSLKINLDLSKRRAHSVLERLVDDGIARERLTSDGYGFSRPIASNATAVGRAKNRRVEFTVLDPAASGGATHEMRGTEKPKPAPAAPSGH